MSTELKQWIALVRLRDSYKDRMRDSYYLGFMIIGLCIGYYLAQGFMWGLPFFLLVGLCKIFEVHRDSKYFKENFNDAKGKD